MASSKRGTLDDAYSQRSIRSSAAASAIGGEDILAKYNISSRYNTTSSSGLSSGTAVATESTTKSLLNFTDSTQQQQQVGYANMPNQIYRRAIRRGFEFNLMVVGETGLGKSTLLNSLFLSELYNSEHPGPSKRIKKTVYVESHTVLLKENSVHLRLNLIDTPGFGDAVDNSNCWCPIIDYIEARFEDHLIAEQRVNRGQILDSRVHCVLYFIAPTGHGLKPLDIEFMKRLSDKANIVPVIAKADCMTPEEMRDFKKNISNELAQHKIRVYDFPDCPSGDSVNPVSNSATISASSTASTLSSIASASSKDDDSSAQLVKIYRERMPFAVVGANCTVEGRSGSRTRGRVYPWGSVEVENLEHNDFKALRNLLLRTHMQDLREVTSNLHYENYRFSKLSGIAQESNFSTTDGKDPMTQMEAEKREREFKLRKMEAEMESVFEMKVKEKKQKLKDSELDLQRRAEQMRRQLEQQEAELSERRRKFEADKLAWEKAAASEATLPPESGDLRWRSLEPQPQQQQSSEKVKSKSKRFAFIK